MRFLRVALLAALAASFAYAQNNSQGLLRALNAQVLQLRGVIASANGSDQSATHSKAGEALAHRQEVLQGLMATSPARALELTFPDEVLADLAETFPESAGTLEQHGIWQGTLYYQIEDGVGFTSHKEIRKLKVGDELIDLYSPTQAETGSKCNELIAASGVKSGHSMVVESSVVQGASAICSTQGGQNVAVILVNFPGASPNGYSNVLPGNVTSGFLQGVFLGNAAPGAIQSNPNRYISDFWSQASDGKTWVSGVTVVGPYVLSQSYNYCSNFDALRTEAYAAANGALDYTQYSRVVIVLPHNGSCNGTAGVGTIGCWSSECPGDGACNISWTWWRGDQIWNRDAGVMLGTHEMGHNLGLGHSGSRWHGAEVVGNIGVAGTRTEYNDSFATMGFWNLGFYSPPQSLNMLGWLSPGNVQTVTSTGVYTVQGYDTLPATGVKALKIARGTGTTNAYFYLAYYPNLGNYFSNLAAEVHGGAIIRYQDAATPGGKTDLLDFTPNAGNNADFANPVLPVGASWTDPYKDLQIQVNSIDTNNNTMTVTVTFTPPPCTPTNPTVTFLTSSNTIAPGASANYTVRVANNDSIACAARNFDMTSSLSPASANIGLNYVNPVLNVAPGATANATLTASALPGTPVPTSYTINATATAETNGGHADTTDVGASLLVQNVAPATPTGVSATSVFSGNGKNKVFQYIRFSWGDVANETSYTVQRCTLTGKGNNTSCVYSIIYPSLPANTTQVQDTPPSGTYKYQVKANNSVTGLSSNWSAAVQVTR